MAEEMSVGIGSPDSVINDYTKYLDMGEEKLLKHLLSETKVSNASECADKLIKKYGSVSGVFSTELEELDCDIDDSNISLFISCLGKIFERTLESFYARNPVNSENALCDYLTWTLGKAPADTTVIMFFDSNGRLTETEKRTPEGGRGIDIVSYLEGKLKKSKPSRIILAHRHEGDNSSPSVQDIRATSAIYEMCVGKGIDKIEHYIVDDSSYFPIISSITGTENNFFGD